MVLVLQKELSKLKLESYNPLNLHKTNENTNERTENLD